jgi:hypothetical protein
VTTQQYPCSRCGQAPCTCTTNAYQSQPTKFTLTPPTPITAPAKPPPSSVCADEILRMLKQINDTRELSRDVACLSTELTKLADRVAVLEASTLAATETCAYLADATRKHSQQILSLMGRSLKAVGIPTARATEAPQAPDGAAGAEKSLESKK